MEVRNELTCGTGFLHVRIDDASLGSVFTPGRTQRVVTH